MWPLQLGGDLYRLHIIMPGINKLPFLLHFISIWKSHSLRFISSKLILEQLTGSYSKCIQLAWCKPPLSEQSKLWSDVIAGREVKVIVLSLPWDIFFLRIVFFSSLFWVQSGLRVIYSELEAINASHAHTDSIALGIWHITHKTKRTKTQRLLNNTQIPARNETRQSISGSYIEAILLLPPSVFFTLRIE